jgi:hypothetical protein
MPCRQQVLLQGLAVCLLAAVPAHSSRHGSQQSSSTTASRHTALPADAAWPSGRRLLVEEFKGAPSAEEKLADAEKLLSQRPDNLLRNLKVKAQTRTNMLPEGCEVSESGLKMRWVTGMQMCDGICWTRGNVSRVDAHTSATDLQSLTTVSDHVQDEDSGGRRDQHPWQC